MKSLNFRTTGWITIVAGIMTISLPFAIAAVAGLGSFNNIFAALGDILGVIAILLIIPAFIALGSSVFKFWVFSAHSAISATIFSL